MAGGRLYGEGTLGGEKRSPSSYILAKRVFEKIIDSIKNHDREHITISVTHAVRCPLMALYYAVEEIEERSLVMSLGKAIHEFIRPEYCLKEVSVGLDVMPGLRIKGIADLLCSDYVVEIKTVRRIPDSPKVEHVLQLSYYMDVLKRKGLLVYIDRGGKAAAWLLEEPVITAAEIIDNVRATIEMSMRGRPPVGLSGPWCEYCPLNNTQHNRVRVFEKLADRVNKARLFYLGVRR